METIEIVPKQKSKLEWTPCIGNEIISLLSNSNLNESSRNKIIDETTSILKMCGNPKVVEFDETGLILGYVQSGKTLSFTSLSAMARDNNYRIIIIIAGISTILVDQSTRRLEKDLRLNERNDRKWIIRKNPRGEHDRNMLRTILRNWDDETYSSEQCRTILITVMKNVSHIKNLCNLFIEIDLKRVPTLIIDDEGDQASLNTRARQQIRKDAGLNDSISAIYRQLNILRSMFSHHTYLQYTATPQAPLFVNIMDRLSPNFIRLLEPGDDYVGGTEYFMPNSSFVVRIPDNEIAPDDVEMNEPPESFLEALRVYFIGVAVGIMNGAIGNRSMLIHPSRSVYSHNNFYVWASNIQASWVRNLKSTDEESKFDLLSEFEQSYRNLQTTVDDLPSFEKISIDGLIHAIQDTQVILVNAARGRTPIIPWRDFYSFILVGGQAMDRGFTVEGLTITYMPRTIGVGNVDTIQQRARFFGYKRGYLGYCRVFLPETSIDAYKEIVEHEENVRNRLNEQKLTNKSLNDWEREVVLDSMLNLTRSNVLSDELERFDFSSKWYSIKSPHDTERFITLNYKTLLNFIRSRVGSFKVDKGHKSRTEDQKHLKATLSLNECLENLLSKLKYTQEDDSISFTSLRSILRIYLDDHSDEYCSVYLMSVTDIENWTPRERGLNKNDEVMQLFQGKNPKKGPVIYPGDREIKNTNLVTLQIHMLNLKNSAFVNVPTIAIWIPKKIDIGLIKQVN